MATPDNDQADLDRTSVGDAPHDRERSLRVRIAYIAVAAALGGAIISSGTALISSRLASESAQESSITQYWLNQRKDMYVKLVGNLRDASDITRAIDDELSSSNSIETDMQLQKEAATEQLNRAISANSKLDEYINDSAQQLRTAELVLPSDTTALGRNANWCLLEWQLDVDPRIETRRDEIASATSYSQLNQHLPFEPKCTEQIDAFVTQIRKELQVE